MKSLMRLAIPLFGFVILVSMMAHPSDGVAVAREKECFYCYPAQGEGHCRRAGHEEDGWTKCEDVPSGGCDFRDGKKCQGAPSLVAFRPDETTFENGAVARGELLENGVFAIRACSGIQTEVVYTTDRAEALRLAALEELVLF